jgi:hypothetical protein
MSRENPLFNMEAQIEGLCLFDAGAQNLLWNGPHDSLLSGVEARRDGAGANIEETSTSCKWDRCHAYGNSDYPWVIGNGVYNNCAAEGGKLAEVKVTNNTPLWNGGRIFYGGGTDGKIGVLLAAGVNPQFRNVLFENLDNGVFKFEAGAGAGLIASGFAYGTEAKPAFVGAIPEEIDIFDLFVKAPLTLAGVPGGALRKFGSLTFTFEGGIDSTAGRILLTERGADPGAVANGSKLYTLDDGAGKTLLKSRFGAGTDVVLAKEKEALKELASAEELVPTDEGPVTTVKVTGVAEIKKIKALRAGLVLNLLFTSTATVTNGENLKLFANYPGTANRMLTLVSDGVNWWEVSRDPVRGVVPTAQEALAEGVEKEPSATRNTIVTGQIATATATRTKITISVGGVVVAELVVPVSDTGVSGSPFCFSVPAGQKFKWTKVEGTVEANGFKFSSMLL